MRSRREKESYAKGGSFEEDITLEAEEEEGLIKSGAVRSLSRTDASSASTAVLRTKAFACIAVAILAADMASRVWLRPCKSITYGNGPRPTDPIWHKNLMHADHRCQETMFKPFRVACPATCSRDDVNATDPLYRLTVEWYFGEPQKYQRGVPHSLQPAVGTFYSAGINYQCPLDLVESFLNASDDLSANLQQGSMEAHPQMNIKPQVRIHMTLTYLCCLTKSEMFHAQELIQRWMKPRHFNIPIRFDRLECWRERFNSITNILVVDDDSQARLMEINHDLGDFLTQRGVPIFVPREEQMPFHTTVLGVYFASADSTESLLPQDDISPLADDVFSAVKRITEQMRGRWLGHPSATMRVTHDPKLGKGKPHTK